MSVTKLTVTKRGAWLAENPQKHITLILLTVPKGVSARDRGGDGRVSPQCTPELRGLRKLMRASAPSYWGQNDKSSMGRWGTGNTRALFP